MTTLEDEIIHNLQTDIANLEEQIKIERNVLAKHVELLCSDRDVWAKEIRLEQIKIIDAEKRLDKEEKKLNELKPKHIALVRELLTVTNDNAKLNEDFKMLKKQQDDELSDVRHQLESIEIDFHKLEVKLEEVSEMNKIIRKCHEKELCIQAAEADRQFKNKLQELKNKQYKEKEDLQERIKELQIEVMKRERKELKKLKEELCMLKRDVNELEKSNMDMEEGIEAMSSPPETPKTPNQQ